MILIVGSTGFLGSEVARRLVSRGQTVRALVRPDSDLVLVKGLAGTGIEIVRGDLKQPTSLAVACAGCQAVISTATATRSFRERDSVESVDGQGQLDLVDAAAAAGVQHFIYVSVSGGLTGDDPLTSAKRAVEQRLAQSGMRYTILRPTIFMEVWLSPALGFDYVNASATIYGSGDGKVSYISLEDVAEYAARSVNAPAAVDRIIELGGPAALSQHEVVRLFEQVGGRQYTVRQVPQEALEAQYRNATDLLGRTFAALMLTYAAGDVVSPEPARSSFGMQLRSVEDYARSIVTIAPQPRSTSSA